MGSFLRFPSIPFLCFFIALAFPFSALSQQPYIEQAPDNCTNPHNASLALGYSCKGGATCSAFLTFRPAAYQSLTAVADLLGVDPSLLAQANDITSLSATFPPETVIVIPVICFCSGGYFQAEASYLVNDGDTYPAIATDTFQGLSTCQALLNQNRSSTNSDPLAGSRLLVPMRCACPTRNQSSNGVKYLLSYLVKGGDFVAAISTAYGVTTEETLAANGLSVEDAEIYPSTILLLPMKTQPRISWGVAPPPSADPPAPAAGGGGSSRRSRVYAAVGGSFGVALLLSLGFLWLVLKWTAKKSTGLPPVTPPSVMPPQLKLSEEIRSAVSLNSPRVYEFQELQNATNGFSGELRVGGSSVYRAELGGAAVAVKRTSRDVASELGVLLKVNHSSIISLSGLSFNRGTWYLIYNFMEKGSLKDWIILRKGSSEVLPWISRLRIALDVANGLQYLHRFTYPPCVHKDVKSSNVLLYAEHGELRAKLANFGLCRTAAPPVAGGEIPMTGHIVGTVGYMAPEYAEHGLVSPLIDVYSFGVVMMELMTGRDAAAAPPRGEGSLAAALASFLSAESTGDFVDPSLQGDYPPVQAVGMALLVKGCLEENPASRPNMEKVARVLLGLTNSSTCESRE